MTGPDSYSYDLSVITEIEGTLIKQEQSVFGTIYMRFLETSEHQIREALIKLGWTPPQEKEPSNERR